MTETVSSHHDPRTTAEYRAAIAELMAEMDALNQQMRADQREIDVLRAQAATAKAETRAILASMGASF